MRLLLPRVAPLFVLLSLPEAMEASRRMRLLLESRAEGGSPFSTRLLVDGGLEWLAVRLLWTRVSSDFVLLPDQTC